MARRGTILQDVVRREVQKLIGFALLNLSWFNPFVLHHGKAHWQWLWQVHKYLVEPWQELKWGQVTSETKRCTFTSPLRTSWTQQRSHGPQGGRASFGLWSVLEDQFCESCESMFRMKATHVQKFFSLGGLLKCPYPLLSAIETKNQCIMYRFNFAKNTPWYSLRALTSLNHEKYCNFCVGMIGLVYLHPGHLRFWVRLGGKSSRISRILTTQLVSTSLTSCFIVWNGIDPFKSSLTVILIYHKQGSVQLGHITSLDLLWMQCWAHPLWSQALRDSFG